MTPEEHSPDQKEAGPSSPARCRLGLKWQIIGVVVGGVILFGLLVLVVVNYQMRRVLENQLDQRALGIATNLGDSAAAHILRGNVLELYALVAKYSVAPGIAFALIRDGKGKVIAHSLGTVPAELREASPAQSEGQPNRRELEFQGATVYETSVPILEGRVGTVSVGLWADIVDAEIQRAVIPLIGLIVLALAASLLFSLLLMRRITRRVLRLKEVADKISMGDLETPVGIESNDEIGDVAYSLERMRASLKAAMVRLDRQ